MTFGFVLVLGGVSGKGERGDVEEVIMSLRSVHKQKKMLG